MTPMIRDRRIMSTLPPTPVPPGASLDIETFSHEERRVIFPALTDAFDHCGAWLLHRRPLSFTQVEFYFELPLHAVVELYAALVAAGLELTRASHEDLTTFCTLRKHQERPSMLPGIVTVRLQVTFLEEVAEKSHRGVHA
jgi:hypothetical protein